MKHKVYLKLGRINANEDEALLIAIGIGQGEAFNEGDLLLTLETTKAAVEVRAPSDGRMISFLASEGQMLQMGELLFKAEFTSAPLFDILEVHHNGNPIIKTIDDSREKKVSLKAEKLAKSLGLDVNQIPSIGSILKEVDVRLYYEKHRDQDPMFKRSSNSISLVPRHATQCIICGTGGHARSLIQMIREAGYSIAGVVDGKLLKGSLFLDSYPILGKDADLKNIYNSGINIAFIGVGGPTENSLRSSIYYMLKGFGYILPPLVSRCASLDFTSHIGEATYVFPAASVGANCVIGINCIINQGSITCHDCTIGDHVHLAPGAILAGACAVGESTTIGMGATIMNNVTIGRNCLVHNNVAIARDVPSGKVVTLKGLVN